MHTAIPRLPSDDPALYRDCEVDAETRRHREMAEFHRRQIDALIAVHGRGVRPGWVSAEIGCHMIEERKHLAAAEQRAA